MTQLFTVNEESGASVMAHKDIDNEEDGMNNIDMEKDADEAMKSMEID